MENISTLNSSAKRLAESSAISATKQQQKYMNELHSNHDENQAQASTANLIMSETSNDASGLYNNTIMAITDDANRDARIVTRKARVQANRIAKSRIENAEDQQAIKSSKEPERKSAGIAKTQIILSKKRTDATKYEGTQLVTATRVEILAREAQRRLDEGRKIEIWDLKRRKEVELTADMQSKIEREWEKSLKVTILSDLHSNLLTQKESCDDLIATKNQLINEYVVELKSKDDEYVKELKRQTEEIDTVLGRMETQYRTFQKTLNEELEQIERAFVNERTELLQSSKMEMERLFNSRRGNESRFMDERADRIEDHIHQLEQLRIHDAEEYNLVKIKLENDVKVLEQQLQQMRATYQLNTEKLEYNYQVLKKREEENGTILSTQKSKIARSTDHFNTLKIRIEKQEKSYQQEYVSLSDDYKRITDQFKELQKKFRHFKSADSKKYREIWQMNEEAAKEKLKKVFQADRIIHEQQLGLEWIAPNDDIFKSTIEHGKEKAQQHDRDNSAAALLMASISESGEESEGIKDTFGLNLTRTGYSKTMKQMLELLCNEAGFLVEERLQKLLSPLDRNEQSLMKLDSILKAIGVETAKDISALTSYFLKKPDSPPRLNLVENNNSELLIGPNDVVKALKRFVEDNRQKGNLVSTSIAMHESNYEDQSVSSVVEQEQSMNTQHKTYWDKFNTHLDPKNYRTWSAVYVGMEKYNQLLSERWQLTQEIGSFSKQNQELRQLLRQYMAASVNDDLIIPPTRVMLARAELV